MEIKDGKGLRMIPKETAEEYDVMKQGRIDNSEEDKLIMQLKSESLTEKGIS